MNKSVFATIIAGMTLVINFSFAQSKKYDVKSGVVTYEVSVVMNGKAISSNKNILYFDDYGLKEREDKYEKGILVGSSIYDGKKRYEINHKKKTYSEIPSGGSVAYKVNFNGIPEADRKSGNAKKLPDEIILGKTCETYTYEKAKAKYAGWKGILFLLETNTGSLESKQKAIQFEETSVGPDKFTVPGDYTKK